MRWLTAALLLAACSPDAVPGLVILDEGARERGFEIVVDDLLSAPVLPVEHRGPLELYTDRGVRLWVEVDAGEVVRIEVDDDGPHYDRARIDWEIDADAVVVEGTDEALHDLTDALPDADGDTTDGALYLEGPDVLLELAWAPESDGLLAVWPLELELDEVDDDAGDAGSGGASTADAAASGGAHLDAGDADADLGLGAWLASWFVGTDSAADGGHRPGTVVALPSDTLDRRQYVGFYELEGKEVALSLDGQVRHGARDGRPIGTWSLGLDGEPVVVMGSRTSRVQPLSPVATPAVEEDR